MTKLVFIFLILTLNATNSLAENIAFSLEGKIYQIAIEKNAVFVKNESKEIFQKTSPLETDQSIKVFDFNFDKLPDIAVIRESGIERYFDVYIFDKKKKAYTLNKAISALACPESDVKKKLIVSTCNHANSCESWQDSYRLVNGRLRLIYRNGTTCDPATGQGFEYHDTYINNRVLNHTVKALK